MSAISDKLGTARARRSPAERLAAPPRLELTLPARAESVAIARRAIGEHQRIPAEAERDLALVVSELVTNAIRHPGHDEAGEVHVAVTYEGPVIRIVVRDGGPGFDAREVMRRAVRPLDPGGRGLHIVASLALSWGTEAQTGTVWAEMASS